MRCFFISSFLALMAHTFPYPQCHTIEVWGDADKYIAGGPLLPKTSIVIKVPVLQQRHLRCLMIGVAEYFLTFNTCCSCCSFPRIQLLLRMPQCRIRTNLWGRMWSETIIKIKSPFQTEKLYTFYYIYAISNQTVRKGNE